MCCRADRHRWSVSITDKYLFAYESCRAHGLFSSYGEKTSNKNKFSVDRGRLLELTAAMKLMGLWDTPYENLEDIMYGGR